MLPASLQADPGLTLDRARALRHADQIQDAVALWVKRGEAAQKAAPDHLAAFWTERNLLARRLLHDGDPKNAYVIAAAHGQTAPEQQADADFLAGFIALRMLNDPARAVPHFRALADSPAAITRARAHYWLGRAAAASGSDPKPEYAKAAAWPTTFYGQLAALALGREPGGAGGAHQGVARPGLDARKPPSPSPSTRSSAPPPGWSPGATTRAPGFS